MRLRLAAIFLDFVLFMVLVGAAKHNRLTSSNDVTDVVTIQSAPVTGTLGNGPLRIDLEIGLGVQFQYEGRTRSELDGDSDDMIVYAEPNSIAIIFAKRPPTSIDVFARTLSPLVQKCILIKQCDHLKLEVTCRSRRTLKVTTLTTESQLLSVCDL